MIDYTKVEDYDCPRCTWSIHVDRRVWDEVEDHTSVLQYLQLQVKNHYEVCKESGELKDMSLYSNNYTYYTDNKDSSLIIIE